MNVVIIPLVARNDHSFVSNLEDEYLDMTGPIDTGLLMEFTALTFSLTQELPRHWYVAEWSQMKISSTKR